MAKMNTCYTINGVAVKDVTLLLADRLLALPEGSWPETEQAETQLADSVPHGLAIDDILEFSARHTTHVHSSRMAWLRSLGSRYTMADQGKVYPALVSAR